ncbi:MAG: amidohydrolase family protein [Armatimonadetes bacterium]|nr:amidohydrolase family protein [Armatimonadota bacterium]
MFKFVYLALSITGVCACATQAQTPLSELPATPNRAYVNGLWYNGNRFDPRTGYVVGGTLTFEKPRQVSETIDLRGGFVVPPLADAHCHHFDTASMAQTLVPQYLREGVFYAQSLGNGAVARRKPSVRAFFDVPNGIDVSYADASLTATLGHPFLIYESLANGFYADMDSAQNRERVRTLRKGEGETYFFVETPPMLNRAWPQIKRRPPDVLKIMLLESDRYEEKRKKAEPGDNGLPPEIVPEIVKRAHRSGLRVFAHVENAYDFKVAVDAGVDGFAHLPGYSMNDSPAQAYVLDEKTVRAFGKRGGVITPTASLAPFYTVSKTPGTLERVQGVQKRNLQMLRKYGVQIAVGSDNYGQGPWGEAEYLRNSGIFTDRELLRMWCESSRTIFPKRKIGHLAEGYEASFLVIDADPSQDIRRLKQIRLRVKQGVILSLPPDSPGKP